jgi:hypothetical protein
LCRICGKVHPRGLGGTAMARIFGLVPKTNALDVYHALTRPQRGEDDEQTIDTMRGHMLEDMAREHFWARTGWKGRATRDVSTHPDYPAFQCHTDYQIFADAERAWEGEPAPEWMRGPGVGETKAPRSSTVQRILDEGMRQSELLQGYTYGAVNRRSWVCMNYFTLEHEAGPCIPVPIKVEPDMASFLLEAGQRFWDEHVVPRVPPDPTEWELLAKEGMPPLPELMGDLVTIDDEETVVLAREVMEARDLRKRGEELYRAKTSAMLGHMVALGHQRASVGDVGTFSVVTKAGVVSFQKTSLTIARPLDWDLVRSALVGWGVIRQDGTVLMNGEDITEYEIVQDADEFLAELELDLTRFERSGDPSRYLYVPRSKEQSDG